MYPKPCMMNQTLTNQIEIDNIILSFNQHIKPKQASIHILLAEVSTSIIKVANLYYNCGQIHQANEMINNLANWLKKDLTYFISFSGESKKLYEWDVVCGLQMLGNLITLLQEQHQIELANILLKDYRKLNVIYADDFTQEKLSA